MQLAAQFQSELVTLQGAFRKLKIEPYEIEAGRVALDVVIPRTVFENRLDEMAHLLQSFARLIGGFAELAAGTQDAPRLSLMSTTDPLIAVVTSAGAVYGFFQFYKLLLETVEKHLSILKMVKEFRSTKLIDPTELEDKANAQQSAAIEAAVIEAIKAIELKVDEHRRAEIENGLVRDAKVITLAVARGTRVAISVESLDAADVLLLDGMSFGEAVKERAALEEKVTFALAQIDHMSVPALSHDQSNTTDSSKNS